MNLDELKSKWQHESFATSIPSPYDPESFATLIKSRSKKNKQIAMRYFWGAFTFHLIVYAFLTHVLIRFGADQVILLTGLAGLLATIPFTIVMMQRFKKLAVIRLHESHAPSIQAYIEKQYQTLAGFFTFKKRYEWFLIPVQCAIGVFITFRIFLPGGVAAHPLGAFILFAISLWSCVAAIRMENKRNFETPLKDFQRILEEYRAVL
jgi:hypothetical protein